MMLYFLLLSWLLWPIARTQFNLYNTDETRGVGHLQVGCLHYYNRYTRLIMEKIEYCLDSTDNNKSWSWNDNFLKTIDRNFTFNELRELNVTSQELLSWSATIDLVERYQYYIDDQDNSSESEEIFFKCTKPWFGPRCQYSFGSDGMNSFQNIVRKRLGKIFSYESPYTVNSLTCYIHLECNRGGSGMCLDWREVCDGRIDCIDGGADEAQCFDLELNKCDENEYRCHNGLCIPKEFVEDDTPQCLDKTDLSGAFVLVDVSRWPYIFDYEEHSCRPGYEQFVCGDGQCVADFDTCQNKRHLLLIESITAQGDLSYTCWIAMVCLTKIFDRVNGTSCDQFIRSSNINSYLQTCEDLIQFPTVPVLFGHVRFLYRLESARNSDIDLSLTPDYVCYDQQLCDFVKPTYFEGNYSCRPSLQLGLHWSVKPKSWASVIGLVERYFRKCLTRYNNNKNHSHDPSLYCCKNSSKCISKHRILDNISDCYLNDDEEEFELSCLVHDVLRFKCANETKCYSSLFPRELCPPWQLHNLDEIQFQEICDRHNQMLPVIIDGKIHTDETDCEQWPCNNFYTRCDRFWSCPNGEDEENCTQQICPSHSLPCVSPYNYTLTCLSANKVGNGHIDCLGAIDELQHCRSINYPDLGYNGFRCRNDDKCVGVGYLCNKQADCPFNDDEEFCENHQHVCLTLRSQMDAVHHTDVEKAICLSYKAERIQFSVKTSPAYPMSAMRTVERIAQRSIGRRNIANFIANEPDDPTWPWVCNHGLYVRHWQGGNSFSYKCFCPPSYYGDKCQYQNQRVSFTAKVTVMDILSFYEIIITLIDDNDERQEIISYHQYTWFIMLGCVQNLNAYLTYATRPKDNSKNYSVRVDVFNKTSSIYLASWHFTIPFSFLPVNRMAVILHIPPQQVPSLSNCPFTCQNGKCMKYINKEKYFCRCDTGWSGARCDIPIRCSDCSNDSICIGVIHNRSICVCPLHKGGPRCLLTFSCPKDFDEINGQCLVVDDGMNEFGFAFICPNEFTGFECGILKSKVEISIHNIKISPFILIYDFYFDSLEGIQKILVKVIVQKLTIFQRTISFDSFKRSRMVFVKIDDSYYLAVLQHFDYKNISTSIDSNRRCASNTELLSTEQLAWPEIRRVKYYHVLCQFHLNLICFFDKPYMCLCTLEHHANCFKFEDSPPKCRHNFHCQNGAECLQDDLDCPSRTMCNCTDCFFGDRCQFYAKGIGLTIDDILRYEIRPNTTMDNQGSIVKWSSALTMLMFVAGLINSGLSILTFRTKDSRAIGCGIYLFASSITSFLTVSIFTFKFWFLVLTQINPSVSRSVLRGGCISLEFLLKVCLYMDNWLNACVALERSITVYKGVNFNKTLSKRIARWIIIILPLLIMVSIIHEPLKRDLFDDIEEQRLWCVFHYSHSVHTYNTIIILFHFVGPFCANIFSALFIIFSSARRRAVTQKRQTYRQHLRQQLKEHKNLIISPIILVILMLPRLLISLMSECVKVSHNAWLYLLGYLVSFIPSMSIFFVFVLPSEFYKEQFKESIKSWRRRIC